MAMSIFGGVLFKDKRFAFAIPIATMLLTDAIIGTHRFYVCTDITALIDWAA